jgi:prepilin-type N-terminal cleavage/methylation domain-containing protein
MNFHHPHSPRLPRTAGFSLIELLTVIAIISILMTVGAIGIGSILGGKSTTSAVSTVESLFDEARSTAVGKRTKARILVDVTDPKNQTTYLRRVLIAYEELDDNGDPKTGEWTLANRGVVLPDQTFFSRDFSKKNQETGTQLDEMTLSNVGRDFAGSYLYYEFNGEGICSMPGASFIVGTGARAAGAVKPQVTGSAKKDFGGFVVWRNGRTSMFRSPDQMKLPNDVTQF